MPQNRLRVVFVGVRADLRADPLFPSGAALPELPSLDRIQGKRGCRYRHAKLSAGNPALEWLLDPERTELVTVEQAIGDLVHLRPNAKLVRRPSDDPLPYEDGPMRAPISAPDGPGHWHCSMPTSPPSARTRSPG